MTLRPDLQLIAEIIPPRARVLDIGCGEGALLAALRDAKQVDGRGLELDAAKVSAAVARGLPVIQGDADRDLADFPAGAFDYAVLTQTIQAMARPAAVLGELARVAARIVVSFPNFGHWRVRRSLLFTGRMPMTRALPVCWHETPNIRLCSVADFETFAADIGLTVTRRRFLAGGGRRLSPRLANLRAEIAVYELGAPGTGRRP